MPEIQLDFFAPPPPPPPKPRGSDALTQRLIALDLASNAGLLSINRTLSDWRLDRSDWGNWALPSRAFKFPVEYIEAGRIDEDNAYLALNHPALGAHPYVRMLEEKLGEPIPWLEEDEFGRDRGAKWRYFHALDLCTDELFLSLIELPEFTDEEGAASGANYAVRYGQLSPGHGRAVLQFFGHEEPADRSAAALEARIVRPDPQWMDDNMKPTATPRFGMNDGGYHAGASAFTTAQRAWAWIHGLEDGWFKFPRQRARKDGHGGVGFIGMTPEGLERMGFSPEAIDLRKDAE